MTAENPHWFTRLTASCLLLLVICPQSTALARGGGLPRDEPMNAERVDRLPPEVRDSVLHMCRARPEVGHYFATYVEHARMIKLHFEYFDCEGKQMYRHAGLCLHEEFTLSGSSYRQTKASYGRCDD
jgi:hypothetical protein